MDILFTICGRAGSKGIKNKNIKDFLGYPLPYYTFAAIGMFLNDCKNDRIDIALNTDSPELAEIAENNPFIKITYIERKPELGGDSVPKTAVILDTYKEMSERTGSNYSMVVDLDLTSPLRTKQDIENLINKQKESGADVTFSVTESRRNPYFNMVMKKEDGYAKVISSNFTARQQAPEIYDMNASLYAYNPDFLKKGLGVLDGRSEITQMYDTGVLDLDHENDFELMQVIAKYLFENKEEFRREYEYLKENR